MLIIWGLRVFYHTIAQGVFFCRKCGGDRHYQHRAGRRFFTLFFIPIIPLDKTGEHVQCTTCRTRYVTGVLQIPTAAAMQAAIPMGVRAMVALTLRAGDAGSVPARQRALTVIGGAGAQGYFDDALNADLAVPEEQLRPAIATLGTQTQPQGKEWYVAEMVRIAMADGPMTPGERSAVEAIAGDLGLTPAQTHGVITLTEQSAASGL